MSMETWKGVLFAPSKFKGVEYISTKLSFLGPENFSQKFVFSYPPPRLGVAPKIMILTGFFSLLTLCCGPIDECASRSSTAPAVGLCGVPHSA